MAIQLFTNIRKLFTSTKPDPQTGALLTKLPLNVIQQIWFDLKIEDAVALFSTCRIARNECFNKNELWGITVSCNLPNTALAVSSKTNPIPNYTLCKKVYNKVLALESMAKGPIVEAKNLSGGAAVGDIPVEIMKKAKTLIEAWAKKPVPGQHIIPFSPKDLLKTKAAYKALKAFCKCILMRHIHMNGNVTCVNFFSNLVDVDKFIKKISKSNPNSVEIKYQIPELMIEFREKVLEEIVKEYVCQPPESINPVNFDEQVKTIQTFFQIDNGEEIKVYIGKELRNKCKYKFIKLINEYGSLLNNDLVSYTEAFLKRKFETRLAELEERCKILRGDWNEGHFNGAVHRAWVERCGAEMTFQKDGVALENTGMVIDIGRLDEYTDCGMPENVKTLFQKCKDARDEFRAKHITYMELDHELSGIETRMKDHVSHIYSIPHILCSEIIRICNFYNMIADQS